MAKERVQPLKGLLKNIIKALGSKSRVGEEEMRGAWREAAGEKASFHSRPLHMRGPVLVVAVDGSGWLYELATRKKEILSSLREKVKGLKLKDIRFRIGEIK